MRKLVIALIGLRACLPAQGQGQFLFNNQLLPNIDARFLLCDDVESSLAGGAFSVQVLAGPQGGPLQPVGTTTFQTGAAAGYVVPITPIVPGLGEGATASVALRFFTGNPATGALFYEMSGFTMTLHTPPRPPDALPLGTSAIVACVPEPSTLGLAALGLAGCITLRCRATYPKNRNG